MLAGQGGRAHDVALGHGGGAFHAVFQFAHIAGPVALEHDLERFRAQHQPAIVLAVEFFQKMLAQQRNVLTPIAQWRQEDRHHIDAEIQVGAKLALADRFFEVLVGGADQSHIDMDRLGPADTFEFPLLQHPQQFGLEGGGNLADLVEKQGSAMGQLEAALAFGGGARERTFFVSEQLRFEQGFGQRGAIQGHERPFAPGAEVVNSPGDDLLAGPAFAAQQHRGTAGRHLVDLGKHLLHRLGHANDVVEPVFALELFLQPVAVGHERGALGADVLVQVGGLADQVGRHLEQTHDALVTHRDIARRAARDAEHADRVAPHQDGHADERDDLIGLALVGAGAMQEKRFQGNIRHHHRHGAGHDLAGDALPELEPAARFLLRGQPGGFQDLQVSGFLQQADHGPPAEMGGQDSDHLTHGALQVE